MRRAAAPASAGRGLLDEIAMRLATSTMFGGGTLVVVRQPGALLRETAARERTIGLLGSVAPGNGLCFVRPRRHRTPRGPRLRACCATPSQRRAASYGSSPRSPASGWSRGWRRAPTELGIRLGPGAAQALAQRVGAYVREGDVDRRRQSELANGELEKLALYRPGGEISRADVEELVPDAIPARRGHSSTPSPPADAARGSSTLAERLLAAGTPMPVLVAQIHRRLRDLIMVREHLDAGTRPAGAGQADAAAAIPGPEAARSRRRRGPATALDDALGGLVELDLRSKGISLTGTTVRMDDAMDALGLQLWIAEHAVRVRPA